MEPAHPGHPGATPDSGASAGGGEGVRDEGPSEGPAGGRTEPFAARECGDGDQVLGSASARPREEEGQSAGPQSSATRAALAEAAEAGPVAEAANAANATNGRPPRPGGCAAAGRDAPKGDSRDSPRRNGGVTGHAGRGRGDAAAGVGSELASGLLKSLKSLAGTAAGAAGTAGVAAGVSAEATAVGKQGESSAHRFAPLSLLALACRPRCLVSLRRAMT